MSREVCKQLKVPGESSGHALLGSVEGGSFFRLDSDKQGNVYYAVDIAGRIVPCPVTEDGKIISCGVEPSQGILVHVLCPLDLDIEEFSVVSPSECQLEDDEE